MANVKIKSGLPEKQKKEIAGNGASILDGFKFGFGFCLAVMTTTLIIVGLSIGIWYLVKALGITF